MSFYRQEDVSDSRLKLRTHRNALFAAHFNLKKPLRRLVLDGVTLDVFMIAEEHREVLGSAIAPM
jgi:hypothetical protein